MAYGNKLDVPDCIFYNEFVFIDDKFTKLADLWYMWNTQKKQNGHILTLNGLKQIQSVYVCTSQASVRLTTKFGRSFMAMLESEVMDGSGNFKVVRNINEGSTLMSFDNFVYPVRSPSDLPTIVKLDAFLRGSGFSPQRKQFDVVSINGYNFVCRDYDTDEIVYGDPIIVGKNNYKEAVQSVLQFKKQYVDTVTKVARPTTRYGVALVLKEPDGIILGNGMVVKSCTTTS